MEIESNNIYSEENIPREAESISENLTRLDQSWVIWENYSDKNNNYILKDIFEFEDIITFWQFWNNYPGSDPTHIFSSGDKIRQ
jgi:hypothetical protein